MLDTVMQFDDEMLCSDFDKGTIQRGREYYEAGHVLALNIMPDDGYEEAFQINATVVGSRHRQYDVEVDVTTEDNNLANISSVEGNCDCPVGYNCKHVVAAVFAACEQSKQSNAPVIQHAPSNKTETELAKSALMNWFNTVQPDVGSDKSLVAISKKQAPSFDLVYVLKIMANRNDALAISLQCCRLLKKGGYGKPQPYRLHTASKQVQLTEQDDEIIMGLQYINRTHNRDYDHYHSPFLIKGSKGSQWLHAALETQRCFFNDVVGEPVVFAEPKPLLLEWVMLENACQKLNVSIDKSEARLILLDDKPWYLDVTHNQMGLVETGISCGNLRHLLHMPPIPPEMTSQVTEQLMGLLPKAEQIFPKRLSKPVSKLGIVPVPEMHLNVETISLPAHHKHSYPEMVRIEEAATMAIAFNYDGRRIPLSLKNVSKAIQYYQDGVVYTLERDFEKERAYLIGLNAHFKLIPLDNAVSDGHPEKLFIASLETEEDYLQLALTIIPQLEMDGWHVFREHPAFEEVVHEEEVDWYSDLDETSEYDYFSFKMGVIVDDEKINLLPIVTELLQTIGAEELNALQEEETIALSLPNGKLLSIPYSRLKPMLGVLIELYDVDVGKKDSLTLSKYQASLLYEIQKAMGHTQLRWFGGEKLRQLGKKLSQFTAIKTVHPPNSFKARLRPYQQEGLNWLQFLREYQLGGVLADDMGLGKTVQTLAHLSVEKSKKRLIKPSLIIAPTSLMVNWRSESEKFSPNLTVLIFQGENRHAYKDRIAESDVVLTTYPLLVRDKAILLAQEFYYLILDEAQCIKNSKAKSTLLVQQIKAEHRLCITGTPMENHLGELWSLYHFLMPGFLGDSRQFKQLFRTPIEKHQDEDRRQSLAMRIKPFMLRRQKSQVLTELPNKTEIIRSVELSASERDLYESIRLSMEKKVRDAIAKKGLSRSHIILLDALLKLRQVCCHCRLLKLAAAKKIGKSSSKLQVLKEMLPNMVEEGRRILIFSQFTTMLSLIEEMLKREKLGYVTLTGATKDRATPIETFQKGDVPIFLISLKAGGTGLNLTQADTIIHYDPWWNPAVEDQATARAHRIGQKKSLFVYKLIAEGTVEETIQAMQKKKRTLVEGLFSEQQHGKLTLSSEELSRLFKPLV